MHRSGEMVLGAFVAVVILFGARWEASASFPDMVCKGKKEKSGPAVVCRTSPTGDEEAEVICQPVSAVGAVRVAYFCAKRVRDWAPASPYAHTPQVWTCRNGTDSHYLFNRDFYDDTARCHSLCGSCDHGWQPAVSPP